MRRQAQHEGVIGLFLIAIGLVLLLLFFTGCSLTRLSTKRNKVNEKSMEDARQNNSLANRSLERQPFTNRTVHTEVARLATEQNEKILGPPTRALDLNSALLTNATNYETIRDDVLRNLSGEFDRQDNTEERKRELAAQLEEQGRQRVEEYKAKVKKRLKIAAWIGGGVLLVAGIIAALVYGGPVIGGLFSAAATVRALKHTVTANQRFFEHAPPEHGARLARILDEEQDSRDKELVKKMKAKLYEEEKIETVSVPKMPPGDKPPVRTEDSPE